jgi:hypothetical protein
MKDLATNHSRQVNSLVDKKGRAGARGRAAVEERDVSCVIEINHSHAEYRKKQFLSSQHSIDKKPSQPIHEPSRSAIWFIAEADDTWITAVHRWGGVIGTAPITRFCFTHAPIITNDQWVRNLAVLQAR